MIDAVLLSQRIDGDAAGAMAPYVTGPDGSVQTTTGGYVGGQPAGLGASGFIFGTAVKDDNYVGMFFNNSLIDTNVGANQVLTDTDLTKALPTIVWKGPVKVRLFKGTKGNVADIRAPFASGVTWAVGDHMYIGTAHGGEWTNVTGTNSKVSHGRVIVPPASASDVLEAEMFDTFKTTLKLTN